MAPRDTHRVTAARRGNRRTPEISELPGVFSQVKRLDQVAEAASEAIAASLGIKPGNVQVDVQPQGSGERAAGAPPG